MTDTPTKTDLLPCPFCGGECQFMRDQGQAMGRVICRDCKTSTRLEFESDAVSRWNTRTQPTADIEGLDEAFKFYAYLADPEFRKHNSTDHKNSIALYDAARLYQASQKGEQPLEPDEYEDMMDTYQKVMAAPRNCESLMTSPETALEANRVSGANGELLGNHEVYLALEKQLDQVGTQKALAEVHGVSEQYMSDIRLHRRAMPERIANTLGFYKVEGYKRIDSARLADQKEG